MGRSSSQLHRGLSYFVEDLATTNGIYVNGLRVKDTQRLDTGDILELGHTVLRFDEGERAPEERTVIEKLPTPPAPPLAVEVASAEASPNLIPPSVVTEKLPLRVSRFAPTDVAIFVIGGLLIVTGLVTAALFR